MSKFITLGDFILYIEEVSADGHCLIHCICKALYKPYSVGRDSKGNVISRLECVRNLRRELSVELPKHYKYLSNGGLESFSNGLGEYKLENMIIWLDSSKYIGIEFLEFISDILNIDIYIIHKQTNTLYSVGTDINLYYKHRRSIIVHYDDIHYNILYTKDSKISYYHQPNSPLIVHIYNTLIHNTLKDIK